MARTFYSLVFCSALGLLAAMWLRPGVAQDLLQMAQNVRMQSPDAAAGAPQYGIPGNVPYSNIPSAPAQPMPVTRPAGWPGAPVSAYAAPPVSQSPPNNAAQPSGVTVWDPTGSRQIAPPAANATNVALLPGYNNPLRSSGQFDPNAPTAVSPYAAAPAGAAGLAALPATPPGVAPPTGYPATYPVQATEQPGGAPGNSANPTYPTAPPAQANPPQANGPLPSAMPQAPPGVPQFVPSMPAATPPNVSGAQSPPPVQSSMQELAGSKVVAKCGNEVILTGDCDLQIADFLAKQKVTVPPEHLDEQYEALRRPVLKQMIEQKLIYCDIVRTIPAAGLTKIEGNINDQFDKQQLSELMKTNNASTRQELDEKLSAHGSSIERERRNYFERMLVMGWMHEKIKNDVDITLAEIVGYYQQHVDDYKFPAQARWEELMVSFDQFPDKAAAYAALAQMGNQVMQGAPLAEVAKAHSQGPTASDGGAYDWTNQNSVSSKEIDQALFYLPVGSLSQIIESKRGFHIVRVLDRKAAGKKSFEETQAAIKDQLKKENVNNQIQKYLADVKKKTPVWTIYDNQPGGLDGPKQREEHPNFE